LNEDNSHKNGQGPSTAAWQALTTYHNIPTDFLSSPMRCRLMSNINQQSEFLSKDWQYPENSAIMLAPSRKRRPKTQGQNEHRKENRAEMRTPPKEKERKKREESTRTPGQELDKTN
jgi:hypothetical protein